MVIWDPRSQEVVANLQAPAAAGTTSAAAGRYTTAGGSPAAIMPSPRRARCIGVQLDDWKLVTGFNDGSSSIQVGYRGGVGLLGWGRVHG